MKFAASSPKPDKNPVKQLAAFLIILALTPAGFGQTPVYWTGNGDRWGASPHDKWSLSPGGTDYYQLQGGDAVHMHYDRNHMVGANSSILINRVNVAMQSVSMSGNGPDDGFLLTLTDNVNNNTGIQLSGPLSVLSGRHSWVRPALANPDAAVFTLAAESTWTIAGNASLLWAIPFTNNSFGITKHGAGTLVMMGDQFYRGDTVIGEGAFGVSNGIASLAGNLHFASGTKLLFDPASTLVVAGNVTFAGFGISNLVGLSSSTALGTYPLIEGGIDFMSIGNVGLINAAALGSDRSAYFEVSGGLQLKIVSTMPASPRPKLRWAGFHLDRPVLEVEGVSNAVYAIESSADLVSWKELESLLFTVSPTFWTNPLRGSTPRDFYRAAMVAAPRAPATSPSPGNYATNVSTSIPLTWTAGVGATLHDVYFGTAGAMSFLGTRSTNSFDPKMLSHNTTYQWRIDERNAFGTTTGSVWTFTTEVRPVGVTYLGAGAAASGTGAITPPLPSGLVPGDLLILLLETSGANTYVANVNGGTWLAVARGVASPQAAGTGTDEVHLTAYYSRFNGKQAGPTTSDSGDHQLGRVLAFRGVVPSGVPWNAVDGTTEAVSDTSGYAPGAVTTVPNTLVVGAIAAALPDGNGTGNFSGWSNGSGMVNLTERTDDSTTAGNGGALGIATAHFAPAGVSYGRMNVTLVVPSYKAMLSVALRPEIPPGQIAEVWPAHNATRIGMTADMRWTAGSGAASSDVYFGTTSPPAFRVSQTATTFDPGPLAPNTTYYWRVDEKNAVGSTPGVIRSFTTCLPGTLPELTGMTLSNAIGELASAEWLGRTVARRYSATVPAGIILSQTPLAGTESPPGTLVDLTCSRGPETGVVVFPNGPDFLKGEAIPVHRNVSLVTSHAGTLLAFAGHRVNGAGDEDDMDIHLRRSNDGGETWGPVIVVADDGMNPCKNHVPVVLPSGRILMLWLWNAWIPSESDRTTREVYVTSSDDDGLTWAPHSNITAQVYQPGWDWYGLGPGHAFIKSRAPHAGRIIFPARHGVAGGAGKPHIIFTDDHGATFHLGGELSFGNESTACEQSDGDVLFNVRADVLYRWVGISADGGFSFPNQFEDTQLPGADKCQASLLEYSMNPITGKANILFSNPEDLYQRVNGTVKLSEQDGDQGTWAWKFLYSDPAPAFSGYSDITVVNAAGDVGILWEFGSHYDKPARWDGGVKFRAITFNQINEPLGHN